MATPYGNARCVCAASTAVKVSGGHVDGARFTMRGGNVWVIRSTHYGNTSQTHHAALTAAKGLPWHGVGAGCITRGGTSTEIRSSHYGNTSQAHQAPWTDAMWHRRQRPCDRSGHGTWMVRDALPEVVPPR